MDCCNDVLSCAGAVASGGTTCVIEAAREALRAVIKAVEKSRDDRQAEVDAALAAARSEAEARLQHWADMGTRATQDLASYAHEAATLVAGDVDQLRAAVSALQRNPAWTPGTATPAGGARTASVGLNVSATPAAAPDQLLAGYHRLLIDDSLSAMRRRIEIEAKLGGREAALVEQVKQDEAARVAESTMRLEALFLTTFVSAVADIIFALSGALADPLSLPNAAVTALALLQTAVTAVNLAMTQATAQEAQAQAAAVDAPRPFAEQAAAHAETAREILLAMRRAARLQRLEDRQLLVRELSLGADSAPPAAARAASSLRSSTALLASASQLAPALASLRPNLEHLALPLAPVDLTPHRSKLARGLDDLFKDTPADEARTQLADLLAGARRRYASDPAMLERVERLLTEEARARGVS